MIALAVCYFVAGSLTSAWIVHLTTRNTAAPQPASSASASAPTSTANSWGLDLVHAVLPDAKLTHGDTFPGATADDVCTPGWAGEHRHITEETRAEVYREYGFNFDHCQGPERGVFDEPCEVDHLIPLELGGSNDLKNLWPQPYSCANRQACTMYDPRPGAAEKDQLENELHRLVCTGKLSLIEAQHCIASNWIQCWE
jgi:hypothetical protein